MRSRFKSTKDLWLYMTEQRKCHSDVLNLTNYSWLFDAISKAMQALSPSSHFVKQEESVAIEECSCEKSAKLASTCCQACVWTGQAFAKCLWLSSRSHWKGRREIARTRFLLESLVHFASWLCRWHCQASKEQEEVKGWESSRVEVGSWGKQGVDGTADNARFHLK